MRGESLAVAVETSATAEDHIIRQTMAGILAAQGVSLGDSLHVLRVPAIPRTANGKVQRKDLRRQLETATAALGSPTTDPPSRSVLSIFQRTFPRSDVGPASTFASLGGDSLGYVQMTVALERLIGVLPAQWDQTPVRALESLASPDNRSRSWLALETLDVATALRAVAILVVVLVHSGYHALGGATIVLLLLVGYNFARFQSPRLLTGDVWPTLWSYSRKILLPYYAVALAYSLLTGDIEWGSLLLLGNLYSKSSNFLMPVWFILNLLQIIVLLGALFSWPAARARLYSQPWKGSLLLLCGAMLVQALWYWGLSGGQYKLHLPYMYLPVFLAGWCLYLARTRFQQLVTVAVASCLIPLNVHVGIQHAWLAVGLLALAFGPPLPMPRVVKLLATTVAAATFYVFVFNMGIIWAYRQLVPGIGVLQHPLLRFGVAVVLCVVIFRLMEHLLARRGGGEVTSH
jgi:hypothetical protein